MLTYKIGMLEKHPVGGTLVTAEFVCNDVGEPGNPARMEMTWHVTAEDADGIEEACAATAVAWANELVAAVTFEETAEDVPVEILDKTRRVR